MKATQAADSAFVNDLERQLTSELRRQERFASFEPSKSPKRMARLLMLIVLCTATGVAAAKAVERFGSARQAKVLVARAETAIVVLEARHDVAREMAAELQRNVDAGLIHGRELVDAEHHVLHLELALRKARLDLEEVYMSRLSPSDEIFAPALGGRDFVTARLLVERAMIEARIDRLGSELAGIEELVANNLMPESESLQMRAAVEVMTGELDALQHRLDLRQAFLAGEVTAVQASRREMLEEARADLTTAQQVVITATAQRDRLAAAHANGLVSAMDVRQADAQLTAVTAELKLATMEEQILAESIED